MNKFLVIIFLTFLSGCFNNIESKAEKLNRYRFYNGSFVISCEIGTRHNCGMILENCGYDKTTYLCVKNVEYKLEGFK